MRKGSEPSFIRFLFIVFGLAVALGSTSFALSFVPCESIFSGNCILFAFLIGGPLGFSGGAIFGFILWAYKIANHYTQYLDSKIEE